MIIMTITFCINQNLGEYASPFVKKIPPFGRHIFLAVQERNFQQLEKFYTFLHCENIFKFKSDQTCAESLSTHAKK